MAWLATTDHHMIMVYILHFLVPQMSNYFKCEKVHNVLTYTQGDFLAYNYVVLFSITDSFMEGGNWDVR